MTRTLTRGEEVILLPPYTLGDHLRKARRDAGLEQEQVAEAIGVSRPLVSKWERDVSVPNVVQFRSFIATTGAVWLVEFFVDDAA